jgi:hypothetical protein
VSAPKVAADKTEQRAWIAFQQHAFMGANYHYDLFGGPCYSNCHHLERLRREFADAHAALERSGGSK